MHCVAAYPAPVEQANLRILNTLRSQFPKAYLGFSDHTPGVSCSVGAVALGASLIEKHVTYAQDAPGPDHWFSSTEDEFRVLVESCRVVHAALGSSRKSVLECERAGARFGRRSLVAAVALAKGERITEEKLACLRPGTGIDPFESGRLLGAICARDIKAHSVLSYRDFIFVEREEDGP